MSSGERPYKDPNRTFPSWGGQLRKFRHFRGFLGRPAESGLTQIQNGTPQPRGCQPLNFRRSREPPQDVQLRVEGLNKKEENESQRREKSELGGLSNEV